MNLFSRRDKQGEYIYQPDFSAINNSGYTLSKLDPFDRQNQKVNSGGTSGQSGSRKKSKKKKKPRVVESIFLKTDPNYRNFKMKYKPLKMRFRSKKFKNTDYYFRKKDIEKQLSRFKSDDDMDFMK